ncbi:MAG: RNA polymerase subunit sigma-70 [Cohnella sp.]|nr:RNA polymerase subunit sigma-70 [Cohnella sp.]
MSVHQTIGNTVRESYGRLVSYLAVQWRDLESAQDALSDALLSALESWPRTGIPNHPEAWLLNVARRKLIDAARRNRVFAKALPELLDFSDMAGRMASADQPFPDERLTMMFICSHPEIEPSIRTPLMLQTVLGIDAGRIASAFVVKPSTMGQRLSRAKARIRAERLTFAMPDAEQLPDRLNSVLEAIYAAYGSGWDHLVADDSRRSGLAEEAIYMGRLVCTRMHDEPEALGLLSFMLHCEARREARRDEAGNYVPLSEQEPSRWSVPMIVEAEHYLHKASQLGRMGRFQLLAAIQSVHAGRARNGRTEWEEIALLYEGLARLSPAVGILVGQAAAIAEAYGADAGLDRLEAIPHAKIVNYQPYWALAAHLYQRLHRIEDAIRAYSQAIGLCDDESVRQFLIQRSREISQSS